MKIDRDTVKDWLSRTRRPQTWLAKQCGVKDQAISNWLRSSNPRKIPKAALNIIRRLMEEDDARAQVTPTVPLLLQFEDGEYTDIERAALKRGLSIREWAKQRLSEIATEDMRAMAEKIRSANDAPQLPQPRTTWTSQICDAK